MQQQQQQLALQDCYQGAWPHWNSSPGCVLQMQSCHGQPCLVVYPAQPQGSLLQVVGVPSCPVGMTPAMYWPMPGPMVPVPASPVSPSTYKCLPALSTAPPPRKVEDCKDVSSPASQSTAATEEPPCWDLDGNVQDLKSMFTRGLPTNARKNVESYVADLSNELAASKALLQHCRVVFWKNAFDSMTGSCIAQATLARSTPDELLQHVFHSPKLGSLIVQAFEDKWGNYVMAAAINHSDAVRAAILRGLVAKCHERDAVAWKLAGHKSACRCMMRLIENREKMHGECGMLLQKIVDKLLTNVRELWGTQGGRLTLETIIEHYPEGRPAIIKEFTGQGPEKLVEFATQKYPSYVLDKLINAATPEELDLCMMARWLIPVQTGFPKKEPPVANAHAFYAIKALIRRCVDDDKSGPEELEGEVEKRLAWLPKLDLDRFFTKLMEKDRRDQAWKEDLKMQEKLRIMKVKIDMWQGCTVQQNLHQKKSQQKLQDCMQTLRASQNSGKKK